MSTWVKVFNSVASHPKALRAGDRAMWLYVCGLCYSNEHLTDGFIPDYALSAVAPGLQKPDQAAGRLVAADLWHREAEGWRIHDYGEVQRSSEEIRNGRAGAADRQRKSRESRQSAGRDKQGPPDLTGSSVTDMSQRDAPSLSQRDSQSETPSVTDAREKRREEKKEETTALSAAPTDIGAVRQVFDAWIKSTGRTGRTDFSSTRRRVIANALKVYPVDELLDAVDGWKFSPHHRGENASNTVYNDLELLLKSSKQVEKFRDLKRAGTGAAESSSVVQGQFSRFSQPAQRQGKGAA